MFALCKCHCSHEPWSMANDHELVYLPIEHIIDLLSNERSERQKFPINTM